MVHQHTSPDNPALTLVSSSWLAAALIKSSHEHSAKIATHPNQLHFCLNARSRKCSYCQPSAVAGGTGSRPGTSAPPSMNSASLIQWSGRSWQQSLHSSWMTLLQQWNAWHAALTTDLQRQFEVCCQANAACKPHQQLQMAPLASISLPWGANKSSKSSTAHAAQPSCPFKPGQSVHGGKYKLVRQAADLHASWLWLAEPTGQQQQQQQQEAGMVLVKVSKDPGVDGYAAACRERDMLLAAQPWAPMLMPPSSSTSQPTSSTPPSPTLQLHTHADQDQATGGVAVAGSSAPACVLPYIDSFDTPGLEGGRHSCLVAPMLGDNLDVVMHRYGQGLLSALQSGVRGEQRLSDVDISLPLPVVRRIARRVLRALDYIHKRGLVHRAVYPQHVVLLGPFAPVGTTASLRRTSSSKPSSTSAWTPPPVSEAQLPRADVCLLGFAHARPSWAADEPLPGDIAPAMTAMHRMQPDFNPPEALIGHPSSSSYDVWQAGCLIWWLATGHCLFAGAYQPTDTTDVDDVVDSTLLLTPAERHLSGMACIAGPFSPQVVQRSLLRRSYFRPSGKLRLEDNLTLQHTSLSALLQQQHSWEAPEAEGFGAFLSPLFDLDPASRTSAARALEHPWLAPRGQQSAVKCHGSASKPAEILDTESEAYDSEAAEEMLKSALGASLRRQA